VRRLLISARFYREIPLAWLIKTMIKAQAAPAQIVWLNAESGRNLYLNVSQGKGSSMAKSKKKDEDLFDRLRALGVRKGTARNASEAIRNSSKPAPKAARRAVGDLMGAVTELQNEMNQVPQKRRAAAKKAARTRAKKAEKRSEAARKAARTRAKSDR
jgi:hypothetical protein